MRHSKVAPNKPLNCPFCDEESFRIGGSSDAFVMENYIFYPRRCIMGHEFYSVEWVPDNYVKFMRMMEDEEEWRYRKRLEEHSKKTRLGAQKRMKCLEKGRKHSAKIRKEKASKRKTDEGSWRNCLVLKRAGEKEYHYIVSDSTKKKISKSATERHKALEKERRARRDEYLKGGIRDVVK